MILIQVDAVEASFPGNLGDITILHASLLGRMESILKQIITLNLVRQIYMYTKGKGNVKATERWVKVIKCLGGQVAKLPFLPFVFGCCHRTFLVIMDSFFAVR